MGLDYIGAIYVDGLAEVLRRRDDLWRADTRRQDILGSESEAILLRVPADLPAADEDAHSTNAQDLRRIWMSDGLHMPTANLAEIPLAIDAAADALRCADVYDASRLMMDRQQLSGIGKILLLRLHGDVPEHRETGPYYRRHHRYVIGVDATEDCIIYVDEGEGRGMARIAPGQVWRLNNMAPHGASQPYDHERPPVYMIIDVRKKLSRLSPHYG